MRSAAIQPPSGSLRVRALAILAALTTIVAVDGLAMPGHCEATQSAEAPGHFVQRLFNIYKPNGPWWREASTAQGIREAGQYRQKVYADFYDPSFASLINRIDGLSGKCREGCIDYYPVCQCQTGGVYTVVSINPRDANRVDVHMKDPGEQTTWTLVLTKGGGRWVVFDVIDGNGSVRDLLSRQVPCLEHARTQAEAARCPGFK